MAEENIFEKQAADQARDTGPTTVPLRLGEKVVGEAVVEVNEVGVVVVSTQITDPDVLEMLSDIDGISVGPMPIFYHQKETDGTDEAVCRDPEPEGLGPG